MNIKELRKQKKITQTEFAEHLGVHMSTIQKWEAGKIGIPDKKLQEIADFFNVPLMEIVSLKYNITEETIQKAEEAEGIYNPNMQKAIDLKMLEHYENYIKKIDTRIDQLENNGTEIEFLTELSTLYQYKKDTLQEISIIKNKWNLK